MNLHHTTIRDLTGSPALEAFEMQDVGADRGNVQDPDAFPADELTDAEVDRLYELEMERRDREAAEVFGGDDEPDPAGPGAPAIDPIIASNFAAYPDNDLPVAIDCLDRGVVENVSEPQRKMLLFAATAELLRRLGTDGGGTPAPAATSDGAGESAREALAYITRRVPTGATVQVTRTTVACRLPGYGPDLIDYWSVSVNHRGSGYVKRGSVKGETWREAADKAVARFKAHVAKRRPPAHPRRRLAA